MGVVPRQIVEENWGEFLDSEFQIAFVVSSASEFSWDVTMVSDLTICLTEPFPANMTIGGTIVLSSVLFGEYHLCWIFNHITHFSNLGL